MATKFQYLFSDIDGTLLNSKKEISKENIDSIKKFVEHGGHFAVATGRCAEITFPFVDNLPITAPAILFNGAAVYDIPNRKFLHKEHIPNEIIEPTIKAALEEYPEVCLELLEEGPIQLINRDCIIDHYIIDENQPYVYSSYCPDSKYIKFVLYAEPSALRRVAEKIKPILEGKVFYTFSAPYYFELLPLTATKGTALKWICDNYNIDPKNVAAIGDFDNDAAMLKFAGLGAAPNTASKAALDAADCVVSSNNEHCVSEFIEKFLL